MKPKWSVLALYAGQIAREPAVVFCDGLVQRFWRDAAFDLEWRDWECLLDTIQAREAAEKARVADILVMSTSREGIQSHVRGWLERVMAIRGEREGILVGLSPGDSGTTQNSAAAQQYLRKLAHQSGLDYLTAVPPSLSHGAPETFEACSVRATKVTNILDNILHRVPPPARFL